jgi:hypothetical protein
MDFENRQMFGRVMQIVAGNAPKSRKLEGPYKPQIDNAHIIYVKIKQN